MTQQFIDLLNGINTEILGNPDVDLVDEGIIDSLDIMTILSEIISQLGVYIEPNDITSENFASAEKIWELVCKFKEA
jgi:acyl carrier protein